MDDSDKHTSESVEEYPDFHRINTPGRALTLGRLYEILEREGNAAALGDTAADLILRETLVASTAYRAALGRKLGGAARDFLEGESRKYRQKETDSLSKIYIELGLASGPHQAAEIVRDIEAQAAAQVPDLPAR